MVLRLDAPPFLMRLIVELYDKVPYVSTASLGSPPGVLRGLIYGMVGRIYRLCSPPSDRDAHLHKFYRHLLHRGHKPPKVLPIFTSAIDSIINPPAPDPQQQVASRPLFFKLEYHPEDPPSHALQHIWRTTLSKPPFSRSLATMLSSHRVDLPIWRTLSRVNAEFL
jgi:hypothetical protein